MVTGFNITRTEDGWLSNEQKQNLRRQIMIMTTIIMTTLDSNGSDDNVELSYSDGIEMIFSDDGDGEKTS
jgi:hypothetical protein